MIFGSRHQLVFFQKVDPDKVMAGEGIAEEAHILLDGMQTSINDLDARISQEKDKRRKKELEDKRDQLEKALVLRKAPIRTDEEFHEAIDTIKYDDFLLKKLEDGSFDQIDLHFLMISDLMPFFDDSAQGQLAETFERMNNRDLVQTALRPSSAHIQDIPGEGKHWVGLPNLTQIIKPEVLHKIGLTLKEARFIRTERIKERLRERLKATENLLANGKRQGVFSAETLSELEAETKEAKTILIDNTSDAGLLQKAHENFEMASYVLEDSMEEMKRLKQNRPQVEAEVRQRYQNLSRLLNGASPKAIQTIEASIAKQKDSAIKRKAVIALQELQNPDSVLHKQMQEFDERLEAINEMPPEELLMAHFELRTLSRKLEIFVDLDGNLDLALNRENQDAKKAHRTIEAIGHAADPEDLKQKLTENLGGEHFQLVSHAEFESEYRKFTESGYMVFYEKGDEWKIIVDETAFDIDMPPPLPEGTDSMEVQRRQIEINQRLEPLRKQLTHELLHLEFEKSQDVKDTIRRELVEAHPEEWQKIRAAFLEMAEEKNKQPPQGEEWSDDDILSELYAMQNEIGTVWSEGQTATDRLNNLLVTAGLGYALKDVINKTDAYKEKAKPKVRGYEEGVEVGEEGFDPSSAKAASVRTKTKEQAVYQDNKVRIEGNKNRIHELLKDEHVGQVPGAAEVLRAMDNYNDGTAGLNEDLRGNADQDVIAVSVEARIAQVSTHVEKVEGEIARAARVAPNSDIGFFRRLWLNTNFMSLEDLVQVGVDAKEFIARRHNRRKADHAAKLGMALFHGTSLGREARAREQKAEAEEVNEWQSRYENLDPWQLLDELKSLSESTVPNSDQLKAILRLLAQAGRIDWFNEHLWIVLNKLQSGTYLKPKDALLLHNPVLLRQKLHKAMGEIWDYNEFTNLVRNNESSYDGEKQKYNTEHDRTADQLTERMDELLAQYRAGERVDPIIYESLIDYCITNGKSYAENVMFHLVAGMAEGILSPDRGMALNSKHINAWPPIEWFPTRQPPYSTADWEALCKAKFGESYKAGTLSGGGLDFKNWFWTEVQNAKPVIDRVKKSVGERSWDHDWGRTIACLGDADTAERFLGGRSGQKETRVTAIANTYVGIIQWLEENAKNPTAKKQDFKRIAEFIAMSEGILKGTAFNRSGDINSRENEELNNDIPRESGIGRHSGKSLRFHRGKAYEFLKMLDNEFFTYLEENKDAFQKEDQQRIGQDLRDYLITRYPELEPDLRTVQEVDQIYRNISRIISVMIDNIPDAEFKRILLAIAPPD